VRCNLATAQRNQVCGGQCWHPRPREYDPRVIELGHTTDRRPPFRYAAYTRVGFSETDAQGVVYYGRYLPYFDLARTEFHRHLGRVTLGDVDFAMRATTVEYVAGARFDDLLEVFVRVERIGRTSITYDHAAYRIDDDGDTLMATAKATLVCIALAERKAVPVPPEFRERIAEFDGATTA
jgi:acyl-CoA thioester hydrolase